MARYFDELTAATPADADLFQFETSGATKLPRKITLAGLRSAIAATGLVTSVAGRTGAVTLGIGDVSNLQTALDNRAVIGGTPQFMDVRIGADSDVLIYEGAANQLNIRVGPSTDYKYFGFNADGAFTAPGSGSFATSVSIAGSTAWHGGNAHNFVGHDANVNNLTKPGEWATNGVSGLGFPTSYVSVVNLHSVTNVGIQVAGSFWNATEIYMRTKWDSGGFNPWARLWTDVNAPAPIKSTPNFAGRYHASDGTSIDNAANEQGFNYGTGGSPFMGPVLTFGGAFGSAGYRGQIQMTYSGGTPRLVYRHRDGDTNTWSAWVEPLHPGLPNYTRAPDAPQGDFNGQTANSYVSCFYGNANTPFGESWYNLINIRHRGGSSDGNVYGGQIAFGMFGGEDVGFRAHNGGTWAPWRNMVTSDKSVLKMVKMTQAAYDALGTKDAATLYVIVG